MGTADIALGDDVSIVAEQDDAVLDGAAVPNVVADDALFAILDDDTVVRAPGADTVIVASETEGISCESNIVSPGHADVGTVVYLIKRLGLGFT